jgi:hypothetical protein
MLGCLCLTSLLLGINEWNGLWPGGIFMGGRIKGDRLKPILLGGTFISKERFHEEIQGWTDCFRCFSFGGWGLLYVGGVCAAEAGGLWLSFD